MTDPAGRVVAADFYLRQVTCLEVAFELMAEGQGLDAWQQIVAFRRGGHGILDIADTPMTRILDDARHEQWEEMGEPARPEHPQPRYLEDHGTHRIQPLQRIGRASAAPPGIDPAEWSEMTMDDQQRALAELYAREAAAQVAWERESTEGKANDGAADAST